MRARYGQLTWVAHWLAWGASTVSFSTLARAEVGAHSASEQIEPPAVLEFVPAEYTTEALAAKLAGSVDLRLELDREGRVTAAEVVHALGGGLDEAARRAALASRFTPARRAGRAVPARILYRYDFVLPAARSEPAPAAVALAPTKAAPVAHEPAPTLVSEILVRGVSEAERRRHSAEAVKVVETGQARRRTQDLGEVLAQSEGVSVRRDGGLGARARFSLNGLGEDQVRFFLDGVPLELAGYPFGVANVPVNLVESVEVYSGVVPVRFGADALGGAVNLLARKPKPGLSAEVSYQVGSFDTHRVTFAASQLEPRRGLFTSVAGFFDSARNDYPVRVDVPDASGTPTPTRVDRFHDGYRALGASNEVGILRRGWAKRLSLRLHASDYDKQIQNNPVMTVPYGAVSYGETTLGATARFEPELARGFSLATLAGYGYTRAHFLDVGTCIYDWFGRCIGRRRPPGETDDQPHDQYGWDSSGIGRLYFGWQPSALFALRIAVAADSLQRSGDERRQKRDSARDPLSARRAILTWVNGLELEARPWLARLENIAFVKQYLQWLDGEEPRYGNVFLERRRNTHHIGAGDSLRYRLTPSLSLKASYEWATRLPRPDEVFGDNVFIVPNLTLAPETSHNLNLGFVFSRERPGLGALRLQGNAFGRLADQLIVLVGNERVQSYQNVLAARSLGVELAGAWSSSEQHVALDGNVTYQDFRNAARGGTFASFHGDRIPNRPYLFANGSARLQFRELAAANDEVWLAWTTRYVHGYYRGWESIGVSSFKQTIPVQLVHSLAFGYQLRGARLSYGSTLELQNLSDAEVFDVFGVQRPGRAFFMKLTAEL